MKTQSQMEKNGRTDLKIVQGKGEKGYYVTDSKGFKYMSDTPEMRQHLESLKIGLAIPATIVGGSAGKVAYEVVMMNPTMVKASIDFVGSYFPTGAPSVSWAGYGGASASWVYGYEKVFGK